MDAPGATDLVSGCWMILGGSTVRSRKNHREKLVVTAFGKEILLLHGSEDKCASIPT